LGGDVEEGLRVSRRDGHRSCIASAILGLACVAADLGDWHRVGDLHGAAQAFLDQTGEPSQEPETGYRQESLRQVRASLGEEQFDLVYARA
jgi:hypothetical protein